MLRIPSLRRTLRWLRSIQNADGGFGETADSYIDESLKGRGPSTASQTAWGATTLMYLTSPRDPGVVRAIRWLCDNQLDDDVPASPLPRPIGGDSDWAEGFVGQAAGVRPLIGAELTIETRRESGGGITTFALPVLVASQQGWQNLCGLVSKMKLRAPKGAGALSVADLEGHVAGLIAMPAQPLLQADRFGVGGLLDTLVGIFGRPNLYVELQRHLRRDQEDDNDMLVCLAEAFRVPVVATGGVRFATPEERPLFDVLTAIREHVSLAGADEARPPRKLKSLGSIAISGDSVGCALEEVLLAAEGAG